MKVLPSCLQLPPSNMDRLPLPLTFSPELLWRYPALSFPPQPGQQGPHGVPHHFPTSPQPAALDFKSHLPSNLSASDPRQWSREDVLTFLRWCEREFDLPRFETDMFQMNGKAMCLLTKADLAERAPSAGDVVHNVMQLLSRDAAQNQAVAAAAAAAAAVSRAMPASPITPTSRLALTYSSAPSSSPSGWPLDIHSLGHLMQAGNSVTLSPAPSTDSQQGSPQHQLDAPTHSTNSSSAPAVSHHQHHYVGTTHYSSSGRSATSHSDDSEEDSSFQDSSSPQRSPVQLTPSLAPPPLSPAKEVHSPSTPNTPFSPSAGFRPGGPREFFPSDGSTPEPNTNGRLLWDFLQQLLNDPAQRYTNYIAWKNRETGVFKIVDPAGLAKLWGIQKNHLSMNYDKMSRALRYYYRVNILRKVQGERHCYQFLRNPSELKNIKNISLLRQQVAAASTPSLASTPSIGRGTVVKVEAPDASYDNSDMPTDLSMEGPTDLSSRGPAALAEAESKWSHNGRVFEESKPCIESSEPSSKVLAAMGLVKGEVTTD